MLEHPASTLAWAKFGLPRPVQGAWRRDLFDDGWVCEVSQAAYGHRARKATWLYYMGPRPFDLDWSWPEPTATVSFLVNHGGGDLPRLSKREAKATPQAFVEVLLRLARQASGSSTYFKCGTCAWDALVPCPEHAA